MALLSGDPVVSVRPLAKDTVRFQLLLGWDRLAWSPSHAPRSARRQEPARLGPSPQLDLGGPFRCRSADTVNHHQPVRFVCCCLVEALPMHLLVFRQPERREPFGRTLVVRTTKSVSEYVLGCRHPDERRAIAVLARLRNPHLPHTPRLVRGVANHGAPGREGCFEHGLPDDPDEPALGLALRIADLTRAVIEAKDRIQEIPELVGADQDDVAKLRMTIDEGGLAAMGHSCHQDEVARLPRGPCRREDLNGDAFESTSTRFEIRGKVNEQRHSGQSDAA